MGFKNAEVACGIDRHRELHGQYGNFAKPELAPIDQMAGTPSYFRRELDMISLVIPKPELGLGLGLELWSGQGLELELGLGLGLGITNLIMHYSE